MVKYDEILAIALMKYVSGCFVILGFSCKILPNYGSSSTGVWCWGPAPTTSREGTASSVGTPTGEMDSEPAAGRPGLEAATVTG